MPFPTTRVIHPNWSSHHQPVAAGTMTCTVRVTAPGTGQGTWDDAGGYWTPPAPTTLYEGPARIQPDFRAADVDAAEQDTTVRRYLVALLAAAPKVPYAAAVAVVAAPADPGMVGDRFTVFDAPEANERFQRNLICIREGSPGVVTP